MASALADEDRKQELSDKELLSWIADQVERLGLVATGELSECDPANLSKVLSGKRALPARLRKRVNELIGGSK